MLKGAKEPRGFSVSHQKGESKPMQKGAKEPRGLSINHLQWGINTLCQTSAELPGKLVQREKQNSTISRESLLSTWIKLV
jgi:hypothetical protein